MPLAGLTNALGKNVRFADIAKTYARDDWRIPPVLTGGTIAAYPLPLLMALCGSESEFQGSDIHVSTLLNDPRREVLKRRHEFFETPDQQLYKADGSAKHLWLNAYAQSEDSERRLFMEVPLLNGRTARVTGKPDHVERGQLIDYKCMSQYALSKTIEGGLEKEKPEFIWQLRFYAVLLKANGVEVKPPFHVFAEARDWRKAWGGKKTEPRMAEFAVYPTQADSDILRMRAEAFAEALDDPTLNLPPCADRLAWGSSKEKNVPKRCLDYCEVNGFCEPYREGRV